MISLRAFSLCARSTVRNVIHRSLSQLIPKDESRPGHDPFIHEVRSSTSVGDVFSLVSQHGRIKTMQLPEILMSMKTIFEIQKKSISNASEIVCHPGFELLCKQLRSKCRGIESFNDVVEVLKILSFLGVQPNSEIYHVFLNLAKQEINSATLMQIVFLDFILQKVDSRKNQPLIEALKISFPILFQMHISNQIDHENIPQLIDYLGFISRNRINRKTALIVLNALILHGDNFSAEDARKIVWSLCDDINPCSDQREKLFRNAMDCMATKLDDLNVEILENTVSKMAKKYARHPVMYHEKFLYATANLLVERNVDFIRCSYFLKGFNRMSFVHPKLAHYMLKSVQRDPSLLEKCRPTTLLSLFGTLSNANFRSFMPSFKHVIVPSLFANELFTRHELVEFPWTKLACDLAALDIFDRNLTEKILSEPFLTKYLARESTIDYLQFLKFYQSVQLLDQGTMIGTDLEPFFSTAKNIVLSKVEFPLKTPLEYAFGGQEYVGTKFMTESYHLIDHVLQFNEHKDICKIQTERREDGACHLEDLQESTASSTQTVAVMSLPKSYFTSNLGTIKGSFDLQLRTLEKLNLVVVPVDLELWTNLPDREKIPFLQREIKSKL